MNETSKKDSNYYRIIAIVITIVYVTLFGMYFSISFMNMNSLQKGIEAKSLLLEKISKEIQLEQENNKNLLYLELDNDKSITKFVNPDISFENKAYIPENLVSIEGDFIIDLKGGSQLIRREAKEKLDEMSKAFYLNFNKDIKILSSYRSFIYQKGIKDRGCPDTLCSKPGHSEHQSGLAIDLWEASTKESFLSNYEYRKYYEWLKENAQDYGFHNTYQKGVGIDGYEIEPWHWRYVGVKLAKYLKKNNLTFAEFYKDR